jgi:hypothetical protein
MKNEFEIIRELKNDDPSFHKKQFCDNRLSASDLIRVAENPYYAQTWELEYLVAQWKMKVATFKRIATYLETRYAKETAKTRKWHAKLWTMAAIVTGSIVIITVIILTVAIFQYNIELMIL